MKSSYKTRRHQLRAETRALVVKLSKVCALSTDSKQVIADAMMGACLIGASAERQRTLRLCRMRPIAYLIVEDIVSKSINDVWDEPCV